MSDVTIYHYANCSSCRNALSQLNEAKLEVSARDVFRPKITVAELIQLFAEIDRAPIDLLSRRSNPYRELNLGDRTPSEVELINLMSEYPALLRRPIIIGGGEVQIGFNKGALRRMIETIVQGKAT